MKTLMLLIAGVALFFSNCNATYVYYQRCHYRPVPPPCPVVEKRVYHYYPDLEIYWCPVVGSYAYIDDGEWVVTMARPVWLAPTFTFVVVETELHDPWRQHEHYRTLYPRRQVLHRVAENRIYHYYPDLEIYWCPSLGSYACFENGAWIVTMAKPAILTPVYTHVVIATERHDPWRQHAHYRTLYPRRQVLHRAEPVVGRHHEREVISRDNNDHGRCDAGRDGHDGQRPDNTHLVRNDSHDKNIIINPPRPDVKNDHADRDRNDKDRQDHKDNGKVKTNDHNRDGHADNGWVNNPRDDRKVTPGQNNGNNGKQYTRETKEKKQNENSSSKNRSVGTKKVGKSQANRYTYRNNKNRD